MKNEVINGELIENIKSAQHAIIRNLNTLNEDIRSKLFSKFQTVKYYTLTDEDRDGKSINDEKNNRIYKNAAAFVRGNNMYFFVNNRFKDTIDIHTIVHELNHILSEFGVLDKYPSYNILKPYTTHNTGINEAMTEFFAQEFYPDRTNHAYSFMTHIAALLCKECGYENMKELYFTGERVKFEDLIVESFDLPDTYLVNKLFNYMDYIFEYTFANDTEAQKVDYFRTKCYQTLCTMKLYKIYNAISKIDDDEDLCLKKSIEFFDVEKYLKQEDFFIFDKDAIDAIIYNINQNKEYFLKGKIKKLDDIYPISTFESFYHIFMRNSNLLSDDDKELAIGELTTLRKNKDNIILDMLQEAYREHYSKKDEGVEFQKPTMINNLLNFFSDYSGKVDLSKYSKLEISEIIGLTLFGKYKLSYEDIFNHFYSKDIILALNTEELREIFKNDYDSLLTNRNFIKCGLKNKLKFNKNQDIVEQVRQEIEAEDKENAFKK